MLLLLIFLGSNFRIFSNDEHTEDPFSIKCQKTVDEFKEYQKKAEFPKTEKDFLELKEDFDINHYFQILDQLSMEQGWKLEFRFGLFFMYSSPNVFAHKKNKKFNQVDLFCDFNNEKFDSSKVKRFTDTTGMDFEYLNHVRTKDAKEGYFQLVVLNMLCSQFILGWHALYDDDEILCTKKSIDDILDRKGIYYENMDLDTKLKASSINYKPYVSIKEDHAIVRIVTFTKWGGFYERKFYISRKFPHKFYNVEENSLVKYDCGWAF